MYVVFSTSRALPFRTPSSIYPYELPGHSSTALRLRLTYCVRNAAIFGMVFVHKSSSETGGCQSAHAFNIAVDTAVTASDMDRSECYVRDMLSTFDNEQGRRANAHRNTARYGKTKVPMEDPRATIAISGIEILKVLRSLVRTKVQHFWTQEALAISKCVSNHKWAPNFLYQIQSCCISTRCDQTYAVNLVCCSAF